MGLTNQDDPNQRTSSPARGETSRTAGAVPTIRRHCYQAETPSAGFTSTAGVNNTVATLDTAIQSYIVSYNDTNNFGLTGNLQTGNSIEIPRISFWRPKNASTYHQPALASTSPASGTRHSVVNNTVVASGTMLRAVQYAAFSPRKLPQRVRVLPNIVGARPCYGANTRLQSPTARPQTRHRRHDDLCRQPLSFPSSLASSEIRRSAQQLLSHDPRCVQSPAGVSPSASYIPAGIGGFAPLLPPSIGRRRPSNLSIDLSPSTPTFWMSMFANVGGTQAGTAVAAQPFLFDSGSQVTVLSEDTAAQYGFFTGGPHPSTPAFTVEVAGVGGTTEVPGFYVDQLKVLTNGGYVTWNHVPVLVIDLPDARRRRLPPRRARHESLHRSRSSDQRRPHQPGRLLLRTNAVVRQRLRRLERQFQEDARHAKKR